MEPIMANERDKSANPKGGPMDPNASGKTAGSNTQSQGGISHAIAEQARADYDPATGLPNGPLGRHAAPIRESLDDGGGDDAHDGRAHHRRGHAQRGRHRGFDRSPERAIAAAFSWRGCVRWR